MNARRNGILAVAAFSALSFSIAEASDDYPTTIAGGGGVQALGQPDQVGGYASTHIVVRLAPGLAPALDISGQPTIDTGGAIDVLLKSWNVTEVAAAMSSPPKYAALPSAQRLARTFRLHVAFGTDTPAMAAQFSAAPGIEAAGVDDIGGVSALLPNDPSFAPPQWNMNNTGQSGGLADADIDAPEAWACFRGDPTLKLAILDTGVQSTHPDLVGRLVPGWNVYDNNSNTEDPHGHGSHVTGIAAANGDNAIGVAGVDWNCRIMPVRCTSSGGSTTTTVTSDAIRWAADNDADVISMSLQFYSDSVFLLRDAVEYADAAGVVQVAAAGNNRGELVAFPARYPQCIAVGGTTRTDVRWVSANYGAELDVVAPAFEIYSLWNNNSYVSFNGTSMATPHVSGLACLMRGSNPALTPSQIAELLRTTADDLGPAGFDIEYGHGRINAYQALAAASPYPLGDLNCDGGVNFFDIDPFLVALFDVATYPLMYPDCELSRGDFDLDAAVNFFDIDLFLAVLFAP